jgi:hypothetical protein
LSIAAARVFKACTSASSVFRRRISRSFSSNCDFSCWVGLPAAGHAGAGVWRLALGSSSRCSSRLSSRLSSRRRSLVESLSSGWESTPGKREEKGQGNSLGVPGIFRGSHLQSVESCETRLS